MHEMAQMIDERVKFLNDSFWDWWSLVNILMESVNEFVDGVREGLLEMSFAD